MSDTDTTAVPRPGGRLRGLLASQFFGVFNDNAWRMIVTVLAIDAALAGSVNAEAAAQLRTTLATAVLTVPLILFSFPAGLLGDRASKRSIIVVLKAVEVVLMVIGTWVLAMRPDGGWPALLVLGAMGAQSALFSPAKYGILPELLPHRQLSAGNAVLESWSTLGIIAGTGAAGLLLQLAGGAPWRAALPLVLFAILGWAASTRIPAVPAARAEGGMLDTVRGGWRTIRSDRVLWLAVLGSAFFWLVASLFFQVVVVYVKTTLRLPSASATAALGTLMVGIALGSLAAGRISRGRVEYGLLPLGAVGMATLTLIFGLLTPAFAVSLVLLLLIGVSGGLVNVPLNALKQWRSPADRRGSVIALSNLLTYAGILIGSAGAGTLAAAGLSTRGLVLTTSAAILGGTVWALVLLPDAFLRLLLILTTNTFYRLRVTGADNIPDKGGAVLVPNHVSFIDAFLLLASTDRTVRFLVDVTYYNHPVLRPFMRSLGAIPISSAGGPKLILKAMRAAGDALDRGEVVCVFPEGQITRIGMLLPFQRGFERIVHGRNVPVIPIFLDRVWGSIFSRAGGRFFTKVPAKVPYPVTIAIGEPLPANTPMAEVRRHVRELGTEAWMQRIEGSMPLHHTFVRRFRARPWRLGFADVNRPHVSRFKALVGAIALARALRPHWQGQRNVGILLPSTVVGALVNIAAAMAGRTAVNLNFTAGKRGMESAARQAGLRTLVTSSLFLQKAELELPDGVEPLYLEEIAGRIGAGSRITAMLFALLAPLRLLERACGAERPVRPEDPATIIFSSGSTGEPKGVVLSHFNVDSNLLGCIQVVPISSKDRVLGMLPFFHSFGYMATLWMAANVGVPIVFHPSPLDAMAIGDLVRRYHVTIMFATPTFIQLYTRRITPGQFGSLRMVIVGAEKLTQRVSDAFRDHFGIDPLEGYGVTETAPVIAVNVPDFRAPGLYQPGWRRGTVGQTIPGVSARIVDPETNELLPSGAEGMILVRGPNVMQGYLDRPDLTAEAFRDGWYVTGDIGVLDEDGFLRITDRYSRFSKIGGEMVPHGVVEEALEHCAGTEDRSFVVTAVTDPRKGERLAVLHTLDEAAIPGVLERLGAQGLPNLFLPRRDDFLRVEAIPLLGSGKTDLKKVREIAQERLGGDRD